VPGELARSVRRHHTCVVPALIYRAQAKAENVGEGTKKEQTQAHRTALDEPDAPLSCSERHRPCSMARQRTVVPRSGRRGRRFKSCHPDQCSRRSSLKDRGRVKAPVPSGLGCLRQRRTRRGRRRVKARAEPDRVAAGGLEAGAWVDERCGRRRQFGVGGSSVVRTGLMVRSSGPGVRLGGQAGWAAGHPFAAAGAA